MPCEMCGKDVPRLRKVTIGGTVLEVCRECARFGEEAPRAAPEPSVPSGPSPSYTAPAPPAPRTARPPGRPRDALSGGEEDLAEDYPKRIKDGRRRKGLSQEDLAKALNEKKSVISRLESGDMRPSEKLVRKLERTLDVRLKERAEYQVEPAKKRVSSGGVTLGDLIRMEK